MWREDLPRLETLGSQKPPACRRIRRSRNADHRTQDQQHVPAIQHRPAELFCESAVRLLQSGLMKAIRGAKTTCRSISLVCCALFACLTISLVPFVELGAGSPNPSSIEKIVFTEAPALANLALTRTQYQAQSTRARQPGVLPGCTPGTSQKQPIYSWLVLYRRVEVASFPCVSQLRGRAPPHLL